MLRTIAHPLNPPLAIVAMLALLLATLAAPPAATADDDCAISWTGEESDAWDDPDNWDAGGEVPGSDDTVCIDVDENLPVVLDSEAAVTALANGDGPGGERLRIDTGGSLTVTGTSTLTGDWSLRLNGGTLQVDGDLYLPTFNFADGTLTGDGTTSTGRLTSTFNNARSLDGHELRLLTRPGETSRVSGTNGLTLTNAAVLRNDAEGVASGPLLLASTYLLGSDGAIINEPGATMTDRGVTSGLSRFQAPFTNRGFLEVTARPLELESSSSHEASGTTLGVNNRLDVLSAGILSFRSFGGTFDLAEGSSTFLFGNGRLVANSGRIEVNSDDFIGAVGPNRGQVDAFLNGTFVANRNIALGNLVVSSGGSGGEGITGSGDIEVRGGGPLTTNVEWRRGPIDGAPDTELRYLVDLELTGSSLGGELRTLRPNRTIVVEADVVDSSPTRSRLTIEPGALMQVTGTFNQTNVEVVVEGDLEVGEQVLGPAARLGGTGLLTGDVTSDGTVGPGASAGTFAIDGDYAQGDEGVLEIELAGTGDGEFDVLEVSGDADLDGAIEVSLLDGFVPDVGDRFVVLTAGAVSGGFGVEELPDLGPDAEMFVLIGSDRVELVVTDGTEPDPIVEPEPDPAPDPEPEPDPEPDDAPAAPEDVAEDITEDAAPVGSEDTPILPTADSGEAATELARTGADARTLTGLALFALLLGAGLLARRRPTFADDR